MLLLQKAIMTINVWLVSLSCTSSSVFLFYFASRWTIVPLLPCSYFILLPDGPFVQEWPQFVLHYLFNFLDGPFVQEWPWRFYFYLFFRWTICARVTMKIFFFFRWTICARVTMKSGIRTWSKSTGEGKLFSMNLLDESGEIRATAFNQECDRFYDLIEVNKVYYITSANLKTANKQFSNLSNDYEMTFNRDTQVRSLAGDFFYYFLSKCFQTEFNWPALFYKVEN